MAPCLDTQIQEDCSSFFSKCDKLPLQKDKEDKEEGFNPAHSLKAQPVMAGKS